MPISIAVGLAIGKKMAAEVLAGLLGLGIVAGTVAAVRSVPPPVGRPATTPPSRTPGAAPLPFSGLPVLGGPGQPGGTNRAPRTATAARASAGPQATATAVGQALPVSAGPPQTLPPPTTSPRPSAAKTTAVVRESRPGSPSRSRPPTTTPTAPLPPVTVPVQSPQPPVRPAGTPSLALGGGGTPSHRHAKVDRALSAGPGARGHQATNHDKKGCVVRVAEILTCSGSLRSAGLEVDLDLRRLPAPAPNAAVFLLPDEAKGPTVGTPKVSGPLGTADVVRITEGGVLGVLGDTGRNEAATGALTGPLPEIGVGQRADPH